MSGKKRARTMPPKFVDSISEYYRVVYTTGVFGGITPNDARIVFYLDRVVPETTSKETPGSMELKHIDRELQMELHCTLVQFKSIAQWMNIHVQNFEKQFGPIRMGPPVTEKKEDSGSSMVR